MEVFRHHIYEFKKGLRNLVLHTCPATKREEVEFVLSKYGAEYQIYPVTPAKINVFFGLKECVEVVRVIGKEKLYEYTDEEDFILGSLLGYSNSVQCARYIKRKKKHFEKDRKAAVYVD
ncbi:MAG: DUF2023 family protein [Fibrobacterota bacterium]